MMWQHNVTKVLSELGWGSGFRLPISNAENVALERELERKQKLITERQAELEDVRKHTDILEKGLKSATDHIALENKLMRAKRAEIEAEKEFQKLSLRELQRTLREYELTNVKFRESHVRNEDLCVSVDERKRSLSELVELIEYDRMELARLENVAKDQDSYMQILEELCDADAETVKKCEASYKSAGGALALSRIELDKSISFTKVSQHQFEGLSERFRKLHDERSDIVHMWKNTLSALQSRDLDMKTIAESYSKVHRALKEKDLELEAIKLKLGSMQTESNSAGFQLTSWDRKVGDLRLMIKDTQHLAEEYRDNAIAYETSITLGSEAIKDLNRKSGEIDEELGGMLKKLALAEIQVAELVARADISKMEALTASEKMKQISVMVEEEEKKTDELRKLLEKQMLGKSRWSALKNQLKRKSLSMEHQINLVSTNLNLLNSQTSGTDSLLEKRKATLYRIDIQFIGLDFKVKSATNPRVFNSKSYEILEDRIVELKKQLQGVIHNRSFLKVQTGHLDDVNRRIYREKMIITKQFKEMEVAFSGYRMDVRFGVKKIEDMASEYRDCLVEQSLTKLKLSQMLKSMKEHKDLLYDIGHQRVLLESVVREKRMEFESHSKLLQVKRRGIRDELMQYKLQLAQVKDGIYKKKNKYEIVMRMLEKPEYNGDGEIQSEAYYVLRLAQEREELRREGDKWDILVKEAEKETEGLQNSLGLMKCSNELFKDSLKILPDESYQSQIEELERKQKDAMNRKNQTAKELRLLKKEIENKLRELKVVQDQMNSYTNRLTEKDHEQRILQADLRNQDQTVRRVQNLTGKILGEITFTGKDEKDLFQLDIKLNATKRKLELALTNLGKLVNHFPDLIGLVGIFLLEKLGHHFAVRFLKRINPAFGITSGKSSPKSPSPAQFVKSLQSVIRRGVNSPPASGKRTRFNTMPVSQQDLIDKVIEAVNKQRQLVIQEKQMEEERQAQVQALKQYLMSTKSVTSDNDDSTESPKSGYKTDVVWRPKRPSLGRSSGSVPSDEIIPPPPTPTPKTPANEIVEESEKVDELQKKDTTDVQDVRDTSEKKTDVAVPDVLSILGSGMASPVALPATTTSSSKSKSDEKTDAGVI